MRKIAKAAAALALGCMLLSTSAFAAMVDNIDKVGYLDNGVFTVELTELGEGESTIIVLPENVALEDAKQGDILYINQQTIEEGTATYTINLGASFDQVAKVYAGGTNMSAAELGTLRAPIPVQTVTLTADKTELEIDETVTIRVEVLPEDATDKTVEWSEGVVPAEDGLTATFTATEAGTYTITATAGGVEGTITIVVKGNEPEVIPVTDVTIGAIVEDEFVAADDAIFAKAGSTLTFDVEVLPEEATDKAIVWSTSDDEKATVENGVVTVNANVAGDVTITAANGDVNDSIVITIYTPGDVTGTTAGEINTNDYLAAMQMSLGVGEWSGAQRKAADVVGSVDGEVNTNDYLAIMQHSLGIDVEFK